MDQKYALFSVTDKTNLNILAPKVVETHTILASGGTAKALRGIGISVLEVSDYTGFPEILNGRVKTLHPKVHAGILARNTQEDLDVLRDLEIAEIDLVVCNLYQFTKAVDDNLEESHVIEHIDIGGPTLIRAAAKNYARVTVVTDPKDYDDVALEFPNVSLELRKQLAAKAFALVSSYNMEIYNYFKLISKEGNGIKDAFAKHFIQGQLHQALRYGENPHQKAAYYESSHSFYTKLRGPDPSYNNILDMQAGWDLCLEFDEPACVIIKHRTPCGAAISESLKDAYTRALATDKLSAYGGVYCFNKEVDADTASELLNMFVDLIIAPSYNSEALSLLEQKSKMKIIQGDPAIREPIEVKSVPGGFVEQDRDISKLTEDHMDFVTGKPEDATLKELAFAWNVVKHSRSNAIVVAKGSQALGIGSGQTSRVEAAKKAISQAGEGVKDAVLASDAFFPFSDSIELAAQAGIKAVISPKGSIRDNEVVEAAQKLGITLVFTDFRAFKH